MTSLFGCLPHSTALGLSPWQDTVIYVSEGSYLHLIKFRKAETWDDAGEIVEQGLIHTFQAVQTISILYQFRQETVLLKSQKAVSVPGVELLIIFSLFRS